MFVRAPIALFALVILLLAACDSGQPAPPGEAPKSDASKTETDRETTTLYAIDVVDAQTAFAFGTDDADFTGSVVLRTTDGGASWTCVLRTTQNELVGLDFVDSANGAAISDGGAVFTTADGGATWTGSSDPALFTQRLAAPAPSVGAPVTSAVEGAVELEGIFFAGALDGWAFGNREERATSEDGKRIISTTRPMVYRTTDGGATWKAAAIGQPAPAIGLRRGWFTDAKNGVAIGGDIAEEPIGVVLKTTDGGVTWKAVTPSGKQVPTDVYFVDATRGWLVGATEDEAGDPGPSEIYTTSDGGETWTSQSRVPSSLRSIRFADAQNGWAVGSGGKIYRTTDAGATWTEQSKQDWSNCQAVDTKEPVYPDGIDQPIFGGFILLAPGRGWAAADVGIYEYKGKK